MINKDRIVPVQKIDLLTLYGTISNAVMLVTELRALFVAKEAEDVEGNFALNLSTEDRTAKLLNQPAKSISFDSVEDGVVTFGFVADYDFKGFTDANGNAVPYTVNDLRRNAVEFKKDGATLYVGTFENGDTEIVLTQVNP